MGYIGRAAAVGQTETVKDSFNGDNSTVAFTMSQSVSLDTDIEVFVGNVQQEPGSGKAYTVSGTTLTFSEAPPTGTGNIYVIHRNSLQGTLLPPQNLGDRNYLLLFRFVLQLLVFLYMASIFSFFTIFIITSCSNKCNKICLI